MTCPHCQKPLVSCWMDQMFYWICPTHSYLACGGTEQEATKHLSIFSDFIRLEKSGV